jgi:tRNA (guanine9-N1)-methyltransferase
MTKSALKRLRRQEQYESQKIARRAREKEKKKTKAAEKRKAIEEGTLEKPESSKKRKKENDSEGKKKIEFGARVVLDVGFDELMNEKVRTLFVSPSERRLMQGSFHRRLNL